MKQGGENPENCDYWEALITLRQQNNMALAYKNDAMISSKLQPMLKKWPLNRSVNALVLNRALTGNAYKEQVYVDKESIRNQRMMQEETVQKPETDLKVLAYPNPATNELTFKLLSTEEKGNCSISLFDIRGQLLLNFVLDNDETKKTISLENYNSGVYFYKIENEEKVLETSKLIIIK